MAKVILHCLAQAHSSQYKLEAGTPASIAAVASPLPAQLEVLLGFPEVLPAVASEPLVAPKLTATAESSDPELGHERPNDTDSDTSSLNPSAYEDDSDDGHCHSLKESIPKKKCARSDRLLKSKTKQCINAMLEMLMHSAAGTKPKNSKTVAAMPFVRVRTNYAEPNGYENPTLKTGHQPKGERELRHTLLSALVAMPMAGWRKDIRALAALEVEHQKLIVNKVWSTEVFEWSDIASAYRARGETVHIGRVFAIVVLKGSELAVPQQLVKARLVFSGNNVKWPQAWLLN